ncbi:MAG: cell division protein FtsL [Thermoanaerobaculia bacterium]|nr:cell division protein FtsL [Thermoanaerobaculia bacterium]
MVRTSYAKSRPVHNRYLVRERDRSLLMEFGRVAAAILVVGTALLGYTWLHLSLLESGYAVGDLQQRLVELERRERHLRLEAAYLSSPARLEKWAVEELGMAAPRLDQMHFIHDEGPPGRGRGVLQ